MHQEQLMKIQEFRLKNKGLEAFTGRLKLSKPLLMECHRIPVCKLAGEAAKP